MSGKYAIVVRKVPAENPVAVSHVYKIIQTCISKNVSDRFLGQSPNLKDANFLAKQYANQKHYKCLPYIEEVQQQMEFEEKKSDNSSKNTLPFLLEYVRGEHNKKIGVMVGTKNEDGHVKIGWSKCHPTKDTFSKERGVQIAINRMVKYKALYALDRMHSSLIEDAKRMIDRVNKYYG